MAYANLAWMRPDHRQIIMGDSDDMDLRDYMSIAAYLLKDPVLKFGGFKELDFESLWDVGVNGAAEYSRMECRKPDFVSAALEDSGNYYIRSSWNEDGDLLHFHCGTMGAGHGHSDKLHVDLILGGEDILTDSGRYTYVMDRGRFEFKDPDAHNTVTVDGEFLHSVRIPGNALSFLSRSSSSISRKTDTAWFRAEIWDICTRAYL